MMPAPQHVHAQVPWSRNAIPTSIGSTGIGREIGRHVRWLATRIATVAADLRQWAERAGVVSEIAWQSVAAGLFRRRLEIEIARLRQTAVLLDQVVDALHRHAAALEELIGDLLLQARSALVGPASVQALIPARVAQAVWR
jgi:hypothetical protein